MALRALLQGRGPAILAPQVDAPMRYFDSCKDLESARTTYRELLMKHHPDRGGDAEVFKDVSEQFQQFLRATPADQFVKDFHKTAGAAARAAVYHTKEFYDTLERVMGMNVDVEVIGDWIHVTGYEGRGNVFKLTMLGFWYSVAHKSMIWSGDEKKRIKPTGITTDNLRARFGAEKKREKRFM